MTTTQTTETVTLPVVGDESIMKAKAHGTSETPVQSDLRWGCDTKLADRICNFKLHYAGTCVCVWNGMERTLGSYYSTLVCVF